jgi:hypothetical protein
LANSIPTQLYTAASLQSHSSNHLANRSTAIPFTFAVDMVAFTHALSLLVAVFLLSVGCSAQVPIGLLCSGMYSVRYLGTIQSNRGGPLGIYNLSTSPNYTNAYINFCNPAVGFCSRGDYACLTGGAGVVPRTLCSGPPTVVGYINPAAPTLGIQFSCSARGSPPLKGIISSVSQHSLHRLISAR